MNLISPAVLRVFTAILSPVGSRNPGMRPGGAQPHTGPYSVSRADCCAPHGIAAADDGYTGYDPNGNPTADFQGDRQHSVGHGGHEADDGFGSDYHPQQG